ncbi:MAG: hypothetical protein ACTSX9_00875 [Candidatus Njordarchaeales archaeon]
MSSNSRVFLIFLLIMSPLVTTAFSNVVQLHAEEAIFIKEAVVIAIDEHHAPLFGYKELMIAFEELNNSLSLPLKVTVLRGQINATFLSGVDILMIPPNSGYVRYASEEARAIASYVSLGGNVIFLGVPIDETFRDNVSVVLINDLLSDIETYNITVGFRFYAKNEKSDIIYDYVNGNGSLLILQNSTIFDDEELKEKLLENVSAPIYLETASLEIIEESEDLMKIRTLPTACSIDIDNEIRWEQEGFPILVVKKINDGKIIGLGFGQVFTNITSPLGIPWIEVGDVAKFFINLFQWVLDIDKWRVERTLPVRPVYVVFLILPLPALAIIPIASRKEREVAKKREERKKEVKISEIIKKIREEEEKKAKT